VVRSLNIPHCAEAIGLMRDGTLTTTETTRGHSLQRIPPLRLFEIGTTSLAASSRCDLSRLLLAIVPVQSQACTSPALREALQSQSGRDDPSSGQDFRYQLVPDHS